MTMRFLCCFFLILSVSLLSIPADAQPDSGRFFLMGSGVLQLKNLRNNREAGVRLLNPDGSFNEADFADRLAPGKTINIESAYRSPEYNEKIRAGGNNAARTSTHIDGLALDFWLEGVDGKKLWETIRAHNCGGIGHYGGNIVHFDAGRPRFWEAATSGTRRLEPDYNRNLYLSSEFDRYMPGEDIRLALSNLSNFQFGVRPQVEVFRSGEKRHVIASLPLNHGDDATCLPIGMRKASRFLTATLPADLPPGRYQLKLVFCEKPFLQMPDEAYSNPIEMSR
jgi:hypothetical protein